MIRTLQPGLLQIRGWFVNSYLLHKEGEAVILDGGFWGDFSQLETALRQEGLGWSSVRAILCTHGHLDHMFNVGRIRARVDAQVYGHSLDSRHFAGAYPYRGLSRVCGVLETLGRAVLGFDPVTLDHLLRDGEILPFWGGLQVLHLPGHTEGHVGFFSLERRLLFAGDLFANWLPIPLLPWPWLNSCPRHFPSSLTRVLRLAPAGLLTNHCGSAGPEAQWLQFQARYRALLPSAPPPPAPLTSGPGQTPA